MPRRPSKNLASLKLRKTTLERVPRIELPENLRSLFASLTMPHLKVSSPS